MVFLSFVVMIIIGIYVVSTLWVQVVLYRIKHYAAVAEFHGVRTIGDYNLLRIYSFIPLVNTVTVYFLVADNVVKRVTNREKLHK